MKQAISFAASAGERSRRSGYVWGILAFAICFIASPGVRSAELPGAVTFDSANRLYEQGKYTEAAGAYEQILKNGQTSAAVYYNLGNAFFKAGQIGRALTAYQEAERITPRDPDLRANLQFARNQVQGPTWVTPWWKRWVGKLTLNEWTGLAGALLWVWLMPLGLMQLRPTLKPALKNYAFLGAGAFALACALMVVSRIENQAGRAAVIIAREAVVRQGPLEESKSTFSLRDGAEVQVLDHKDDWVQVTTDPRRIGWVHRDQLILTPEI